ncbi:beta-1,4-N-acetylgalactosaminyltransferase 3-like [Xenia sp. Carnegie-2017]|uniref:beta-1,4-N-acetylgalactosaminyltransferase 3-like n=1 Tax=Xenia sp. Carnegie-2017 TaxID=2897299 RepID=UPI001F045476|nr:beta-1,4-N-acetylgalactosaminyltransferase 3-like [Xenia sp. Carnegie-2017]
MLYHDFEYSLEPTSVASKGSSQQMLELHLRRDEGKRIGGMDVERFRPSYGGEDWDPVVKILADGLKIERLKVLTFFHFYHTKKGMWKDSEQKLP